MMRLLWICNAIVLVILAQGCDTAPRHPFDAKKWKEWDEGPPDSNARSLMVADLQRNVIHEGITTKDQIEELLGEPLTMDRFTDGSVRYYYYLRQHSACWAPDVGYLAITFQNDLVVSSNVLCR
jgi:outer membrane protein assembly factor BamE (lipoprotein component of BamABCDE complex)